MSAQLDHDFQLMEAQCPHVAKALKLLWGYPEAAMYVAKLLEDTRNGARHGFSQEVLEALLNVQELHQNLQPATKTESDPWGDGRDLFR
jgi:hypothetical protein